jgi:hypothetical protein
VGQIFYTDQMLWATSWECGGLAAWRAGGQLQSDGRYWPFTIASRPGVKEYPTLAQAKAALATLGADGGLIIARQWKAGAPTNYATLLGTDEKPCWEYVNHGWNPNLGLSDPRTARIIHDPSPNPPGGFDKTEYIVIPGKSTRFRSPNPKPKGVGGAN